MLSFCQSRYNRNLTPVTWQEHTGSLTCCHHKSSHGRKTPGSAGTELSRLPGSVWELRQLSGPDPAVPALRRTTDRVRNAATRGLLPKRSDETHRRTHTQAISDRDNRGDWDTRKTRANVKCPTARPSTIFVPGGGGDDRSLAHYTGLAVTVVATRAYCFYTWPELAPKAIECNVTPTAMRTTKRSGTGMTTAKAQ